MKIEIEKSSERGYTKLPWLNSKHSFSFSSYQNPKRMNFGKLRVFNDDIVDESAGFGMHSHSNFEIVSIVLKGTLEHKDSMGNHGIIKTGELQRITAGTGISHSEFNPSKKEKVHFLQIWIEPRESNLAPEYEQVKLILKKNSLNKISIKINQNSKFFLGEFNENEKIKLELGKDNGAFIFIIGGKIKIEESNLLEGDSAQVSGTSIIKIDVTKNSKFLIIEVPLH